MGCQTGHSTKMAAMENASFMDLWKTYSHCQSEYDVDGLRSDAGRLATAINTARSNESFVLPLPRNLERFVSNPTSRYAVDVKAMAAACSIRAAHLAADAGNFDMAKDLLKTALSQSQSEGYEYYSTQAKILLADLESKFVQISLGASKTTATPPSTLY
jgi:hypothetical protein